MWMRLRQIAVVAQDLQKVGSEITGVLGVEACFTDPGVKQFGLKNTLWPIGTQMLEVVTPITDGTPLAVDTSSGAAVTEAIWSSPRSMMSPTVANGQRT